jgi:inosine-uridine nucleoside N-ribohydrolase
MATRVIIDTDPGIDDAQAILFALFCGEFEVDALTSVFGNVPAKTAAANVLRLLEMAGRPEIPVYLGAVEPLVRRRLHYAPEVHGKRGFGDLKLPPPRGKIQKNYAAVELAQRIVQAPGEITILALGPLTNIALAIRLEPQFVKHVREIIFMGGIVAGHGNVSAVATANVLNDSEAAKIVFNAGFRCLTMVGQDVTRPTRMLPERRERLRQAGGEIAEFLYEITRYYGNSYTREQIPGFPVHDLLVMIYALRPALFMTRLLHVDVETEGALTEGMTVADFRPYSKVKPNVNVCMKADSDAIFDWYEKVIMTASLARAQGTNS